MISTASPKPRRRSSRSATASTWRRVSETGWPYVQHRGGPRGFLSVLDDRTLALADFRGQPPVHQRRQPCDQRPRRAHPDGLSRPRGASRSTRGRGEERSPRIRPWPSALAMPGYGGASSASSSCISRRSTGTARSTSRRASAKRSWPRCSNPCGSGSSRSNGRTGCSARSSRRRRRRHSREGWPGFRRVPWGRPDAPGEDRVGAAAMPGATPPASR